jgi:peroxiredoxin
MRRTERKTINKGTLPKSKKKAEIKKVLVLGSGALKICEARVRLFRSQALKALKEEKIQIFLLSILIMLPFNFGRHCR